MEIKIDLKNIIQFEDMLAQFSDRAMPFATKNTLNQYAFTSQKIAREDVKNSFINRNKFSQQSIRVNQAKGLDISLQQSSMGSIAEYMETQEFGGIKTKKGKRGVPIATSYSAGLPQNAIPRTRLVRKSNKLANIHLKRFRYKSKSQKQRNFVAIKLAAENGRKFVFLDFGTRQGIYRVIGGKKKPRIKLIADLSNKAVRIPKHSWLRPAVEKLIPLMADIHIKSLQFQIDRAKLFRNK